MFSKNTSTQQNGTTFTGKKSLDLLKTNDERKEYASALMGKVKGHIPIILETLGEVGLDLLLGDNKV